MRVRARIVTITMAVTRRDMSNEYLYIGDQIYLSEEASGYLASQGFSNVAVGMSLARDSVPRECVFQVRQQHNYTVAKQMRAALEREGLTMAEAQGDSRFRKLVDDRARERALNFDEFQQQRGREVRYGMIVQLQHVSSQKYISVSRQSAQLNKDGRRVLLDRDAGEGAWFRISPRLRVHSDGEKVHAMDPVVLYHVNTGLPLHVESGQLPDGKREVSGTIDFSAFKVMIYRNYLEERASKEEKVCLGGAQVLLLGVLGEREELGARALVIRVGPVEAPARVCHLLAHRPVRDLRERIDQFRLHLGHQVAPRGGALAHRAEESLQHRRPHRVAEGVVDAAVEGADGLLEVNLGGVGVLEGIPVRPAVAREPGRAVAKHVGVLLELSQPRAEERGVVHPVEEAAREGHGRLRCAPAESPTPADGG